MRRRDFVLAALGFSSLAWVQSTMAAQGRVVIVGGGWGGLAAARHLRRLAPDMEVVLIERQAAFWSWPLSNRWLVGLTDETSLRMDYLAAARRQGYRFVQDEVLEIDRAGQKVITRQGVFSYDWLVLAAGVREDFSPWFGGDRKTAEWTRETFPSACVDLAGARRLKRRLEDFQGGDWVMTIPPLPYRCPPAPYERAGMLAWWLKHHRIKGRLILLDPNPPALSFDRVFRDTYRAQMDYLPQARIRTLDPYRKQVVTDFETIDFDEAILMPPQQAADPVWQAGLIGRDGQGQATGWAAQHPLSLQADADSRVFVIGDSLGKVSPLFGFYPKTGQMAARQGLIAARQIAAQAAGLEAEVLLPSSSCFVVNRLEPLEIVQIDTQYRVRPDGLIQQSLKQRFYPVAAQEDEDWAQGMYGELGFQ